MRREYQRGYLIQEWRELGHVPDAPGPSVRSSSPVEAVSLDSRLETRKGRSTREEDWAMSACPTQ